MPTDDTLINFHKTLSAVLDVAWSHDSKYLACSAVGGTILIVDTTTGFIIATYKSIDHRAGPLFFSPDSHLLASPGESGMEIWNVLTHERVFLDEKKNIEGDVVQGPTESLEENDRIYYTWSPNGKQVAVGLFGSSEDATSGPAIYVEEPERQTRDSYYTLIQIWQSESLWASHTQRLYRTLVLISGTGIGPGISCFSWSPDGETLAIGQRRLVHLWRPRTEQVVATYTSGIRTAPEDLWDFIDDVASIRSIYWSPDGSFLACVGYIGIEIWEVATGEKLVTYYEHISAIVDIKWLMKKSIIVSVDQRDLHLWHFRDGRVLQKVSIPYPRGEEDSALFSAALSPDLSFLACAGYKGKVPLTEELEGILWTWKHTIEDVLEGL